MKKLRYPYSHIKRKIIKNIKNILPSIRPKHKKNIINGTLNAAIPESIAAGPPDSNLKSCIKTYIQVETLKK